MVLPLLHLHLPCDTFPDMGVCVMDDEVGVKGWRDMQLVFAMREKLLEFVFLGYSFFHSYISK